MSNSSQTNLNASSFLLFNLAGQAFGISVKEVLYVEELEGLGTVPLAGDHVAGIAHLHGQIATVINLRAALNLPNDTPAPSDNNAEAISFIIDDNGHKYCMLIDSLIGVFDLDINWKERIPDSVTPSLRKIGTGVMRYEDQLVLSTDKEALMEMICPAEIRHKAMS